MLMTNNNFFKTASCNNNLLFVSGLCLWQLVYLCWQNSKAQI